MPPKKSAMKLAEEAIRMIEALNLPRAEEAFPQDVMPDEALKLIRKAQYAQKKYEDKGKKDKKYVEKHAVERPTRPPNAWVEHVKAYQAQHRGMSYKEAMSRAKETYRKP
jgi:hypothetical protein